MESVKIVYVLDDELPTLRCMIRTSCWLRYSCAELYLAFYCDFIIIPFLCADPSRHNMPPADYYVRRSHSLCPFRRIVSRRTEYRMFIALLCCTESQQLSSRVHGFVVPSQTELLYGESIVILGEIASVHSKVLECDAKVPAKAYSNQAPCYPFIPV